MGISNIDPSITPTSFFATYHSSLIPSAQYYQGQKTLELQTISPLQQSFEFFLENPRGFAKRQSRQN